MNKQGVNTVNLRGGGGSSIPAATGLQQIQNAIKEHPDAEYLKRDDIGLVIAKGLAVMYKSKPHDPVDFLAKWLLNQVDVNKKGQAVHGRVDVVKNLKSKFDYEQKKREKTIRKQQEVDEQVQEQRNEFQNTVENSTDLTDQLQDLANFLKEQTKSTAVYIGKLVTPKKKINEADDENSHLDDESKKIIHFLQSTEGHEFMVDQILRPDQGLTFDVFQEQDQQQQQINEMEGAEGQEIQIDYTPKYVYVPDVVREPRMHFFKVPRLGAYLSIKLEYDSCLNEKAYDTAIQDYIEVNQKLKEQEEEKRQFYEKQDDDQKDKVGDTLEEEGRNDTSQNQLRAAEDRQWEEITYKPFVSEKVSYVVCLNTLGQDREFLSDEKDLALQMVLMYKNKWEEKEKMNLDVDIHLRLEYYTKDKKYKEIFEPLDNNELEKQIEDELNNNEDIDLSTMDEETKGFYQNQMRLKILTRQFYINPEEKQKLKHEHELKIKREQELMQQKALEHQQESMGNKRVSKIDEKKKEQQSQAQSSLHKDEHSIAQEAINYIPLPLEQWQADLLRMTQYHVIKMRRVWQTVFYLLRYSREQICERDTNKLEWKKAKTFLNMEFLMKLETYNPIGPKEDEYKVYQKLKFLEKNLEIYAESTDQIDEYCVALGKLYRWTILAIEVRKQDVQRRRAKKTQLKDERDKAITDAELREQQRTQELELAIAEFEAQAEAEEEEEDEEENQSPHKKPKDKPKFDDREFLKQWDEANPKVAIPPEVIDDIDNDYDFEDHVEDQ